MQRFVSFLYCVKRVVACWKKIEVVLLTPIECKAPRIVGALRKVSFVLCGFAAISLLPLRSSADEVSCLANIKSQDQIQEKYGEEAAKKIELWLKNFENKNKLPQFICSVERGVFLVGVVTVRIGTGTYLLDVEKTDFTKIGERFSGYVRLVEILYDKENKPSFLLSGGGLNKYEGVFSTDYGIVNYQQRTQVGIYTSIHSLLDNQECTTETEDGEHKEVTIERVGRKIDYKIIDVDRDGYKDLLLDITEFDCRKNQEINFSKIYYATENGFQEGDKE